MTAGVDETTVGRAGGSRSSVSEDGERASHREAMREEPPAGYAAPRTGGGCYGSPVTSAKVRPSYPLLPTVWSVVALTRGSAP